MAALGLRPWGRKKSREAQIVSDAALNKSFEDRARAGVPATWDYKEDVVQQTLTMHERSTTSCNTPSSSYSSLVRFQTPASSMPMKSRRKPEVKKAECPTAHVPSYIQHVQRPGFIQPHGSLILVQPDTWKVLAYGENIWEFLDGEAEMGIPLLGRDARKLFSKESAKEVEVACKSSDLALLNPLAVTTSHTGKPLYAILHHITEGIVIDLENIGGEDVESCRAMALEMHEMANMAVMKMQEVPAGNLQALVDIVVQEVKRITGYDRTMVYKFHEDEHGEVIGEAKEDWLPPLLGLHYPANDIPQANRRLFVEVRVRMISDMEAGNVNVIQDESILTPIVLSRSTMRGVAGCHKEYSKNMGLQASLSMAVVVDEPELESHHKHLYGLVVSHHHSGARIISYPQRYAADFIVQAFALRLSQELEDIAFVKETQRMHTQAVLCGMVSCDALLGLIKKTPNIQDLIQSDGAVIICKKQVYTVGTTPTADQVFSIAAWLMEGRSSLLRDGLFSTISLEISGYPNHKEIEPDVCGLLAVIISGQDFLMWFRSGVAKTTVWSGAKETHNVKEGANMHPRASFEAWLEVAKVQSKGWVQSDLDAAQSLKLIIRDSLPEYAGGMRTDVQARLNMERLNIQRQLTDMDRTLQMEMESSQTPIVGLCNRGTIMEWNPKMVELTCMQREDVWRKTFIELLVHPSDHDKIASILEGYGEVSDNEPVEVCLMVRSSPDGPQDRQLDFLLKLYYQHDMFGNLLTIRMLGEDITWLKIVRGRDSTDEEYQRQLSRSNVMVFAVDKLWQVTEWTPGMEQISGLGRSQVLGRRLVHDVLSSSPKIRVTSQDSLVPFEVALVRALHGADTWNHEMRFQTWEGKQMDTLMHVISRRRSESGELLGATCYVQDMLEQRVAENALAVRMVAESASQAKTMQLACLCHEIRNPLNGILSSIDFMADTNLSPEQSELIVTTAQCGRYLRRIVDDVLDLSKIEEGKLELESEPFSLAHVLDAVLAQEVGTVGEKGLLLYATMDPAISGVLVKGDKQRMQQVVANFARNAVEYTDKGWVEVKVRAEVPSSPELFRCSFLVSDTGKGIPKSQLPDIFEIPSSSDTTESTPEAADFNGTGLGLVVCHRLACLMGGAVQCESIEGVGSCFSLTMELPISATALEEPDDCGPFGDTPGLRSTRKGVLYTLIGEWSAQEDIDKAEIISPTINRDLSHSPSPLTSPPSQPSVSPPRTPALPELLPVSTATAYQEVQPVHASLNLSVPGTPTSTVPDKHEERSRTSTEKTLPLPPPGIPPPLGGELSGCSESRPFSECRPLAASSKGGWSGSSTPSRLSSRSGGGWSAAESSGKAPIEINLLQAHHEGSSPGSLASEVGRMALGGEEKLGIRWGMGSESEEISVAVAQLEEKYRGQARIDVAKEHVDKEEVAVLVTLSLEDEYTRETLLSLSHWGSVKRRGSLGESLQSATRVAVLEATRKALI